MKFGVNETARLLEQDRETVKAWAYHFREYLSADANPTKGSPRRFSIDDLYVFAYVSGYWEDNPDFENIRYGLNCDDHRAEIYREFVAAATPLFQEPPEELDETWQHGALMGGIVAGTFDTFTLANSYKRAGDILVDSALDTLEASTLLYPVLYNYRHATELYLKAVVSPALRGHDLKPLLDTLEQSLRTEFKAKIPIWFKGVVLDFIEFDPTSTTFRYGNLHAPWGGEHWVDLPHVKLRMGWVASSFHRILEAMMRRPESD
jgi:hypothetical protein